MQKRHDGSRVLITTTVILAVVVGLVLFNKFATSHIIEGEYQVQYEGYILVEFMPREKRKTGKWPHDLTKLTQYLTEDLRKQETHQDTHTVGGNLQRMLDFHQNHHCSLKVTHENDKNVTFFVYVNGKAEHDYTATTEWSPP